MYFLSMISKLHNSAQAENLPSEFAQLRSQNEALKSQLMSASLINELTKVLHSCTDLDNIIKTVLLAIQEILEFDRVILFSIDKTNFRLIPQTWVGISDSIAKKLSISLGFEGGEITDAIFLNRHIIIEEPDLSSDIFHLKANSSSYLVLPIVNKANHKCWEIKNCTKTACPAHSGFNPYCWSIQGSGQLLNATNEDDKRLGCLSCKCFKAEGVFWMDRQTSKEPITSDDITTLSAIINISSIVIENYRILNALDTANNNLHSTNEKLNIVNHDLQVAQAKIRSDLEHARSIQQGLLPQELDDNSAISIGARYLSADAVGGDYYDVFEIVPGISGIIVADVSGHGIASALIMAMAKVLLKTFASNELSPQKTLERINTTFLSEINTDNFVTIFYAVLDTNNQILKYTSAGHCPILFLNKEDSSCTLIKADGLFMGVFPDMMLKETERPYASGKERIVLYTDGLVEAKAKCSEEMFGVDRLCEIAVNTLSISPEDAVETIIADQKSFCGADAIPEDDITVLVIDL